MPFGKVKIGATHDVKFRIRNISRTRPLQITVLDAAAPFSVTQGLGQHFLILGDAQVVTVRFAPTFKGKATSRLAISSTDPKRPLVKVQLVGTGK